MEKRIFFKIRKECFLMVFAIFAVVCEGLPQDKAGNPAADKFPQVSLPNTEIRPLFSKILNQEMEIYIKLPASYHNSPQRHYPGWYGTDANYSFSMMASLMSYFEDVKPEICLIGVGYKIRDVNDWIAWRTRDLTFVNDPTADARLPKLRPGAAGAQFEVKTGGAAKFLEFMAKELFPFIESNYRVSPTGRGIGGYSLGGLFSLYVLLKQPDLFSIYYAGSPSMVPGIGDILFDYEKEYASSHKDLNARLFMSAGGKNDVMFSVKKMADLLQSRSYPGLKVETQVFPDETHESCAWVAVRSALKVLYQQPAQQPAVSNAELFIHKAPDFTLTIPKDWTSDKSLNPDSVLRKTFTATTVLDVVVSNLSEGKSYKDMAKDFIGFVQERYQSSNCQVLYEREIKLKDGTPAYELEVKWNHPMILLFTYELVVFKDKKIIGVTMTDPAQVSDDLKQFPLSLTLK